MSALGGRQTLAEHGVSTDALVRRGALPMENKELRLGKSTASDRMIASSPNDTLGLFDTPPNRAEIRFGYLIVGVLIATLLVVFPFRDIRLRGVTAFIPTVDSIIFVGDLITATLLYGQSSLFRSRALLALATGYLFGALLLIPHVLTFPGAFSAEGLLGAGVNTTAWLSVWQRAAFPIAAILYVLFGRAETIPRIDRQPYWPSIFGAVLLAL